MESLDSDQSRNIKNSVIWANHASGRANDNVVGEWTGRRACDAPRQVMEHVDDACVVGDHVRVLDLVLVRVGSNRVEGQLGWERQSF